MSLSKELGWEESLAEKCEKLLIYCNNLQYHQTCAHSNATADILQSEILEMSGCAELTGSSLPCQCQYCPRHSGLMLGRPAAQSKLHVNAPIPIISIFCSMFTAGEFTL